MPLVKQLYNLFCFCYSYAPASHPGPSGILRTCSPLPLQSTEDLTSRCGSRLVILTGFYQGALIQGFGMFSTSKVIKVTYMLVLRSSLQTTIGMCTYEPHIYVTGSHLHENSSLLEFNALIASLFFVRVSKALDPRKE